MLDEVGINFEHVETLFNIEFIVQADLVGDLVFLFHEIKALWNDWIVLVLLPTNLG